jgi:DNA modification methylase
MYGTARCCRYDWGLDPARGDPEKHWRFHRPIYRECLRVLRPGGVLAWGQGVKFHAYFAEWFGGHRAWALIRIGKKQKQVSGHLWIVQTREQVGVPFPPDKDGVIEYDRLVAGHPCAKPVEELRFMVESLTEPGDLCLDCFCGTGTTLVACQQLGRSFIGCDISRKYVQMATARLRQGKPYLELRNRTG